MTLERPRGITPDEAGPAQGLHNQSVLKAVALISCFIDSSEARTLSQLARRTGLNVSTAYRILRTLTATGVLYRHEGEERYVAGPMLLAMAGAIHGTGGFGRVMEALRDLAADTGESASLGVRDGDCLAVIFAVPAPQLPRFEHRPGTRINIHCSAMGKAILAFGPEAEMRRRVAGLGVLQPATPHSLTDPAALLDDLAAVRQAGRAISRNAHTIGVTSLAVAIPGSERAARAAVGLQMPNARWSPDREAGLVAALSAAAARLAGLEELARIPAN